MHENNHYLRGWQGLTIYLFVYATMDKKTMALKDLVLSKATLTEEVIEKIVSGRVHYDVDECTISLTASGASLPAKKKLLTYLVALQGWPYVTDSSVHTDASPAELEQQLGIPGGTIRPMLTELRDKHLLSNKGGRYSVRAGGLHAITAELQGTAMPDEVKPASAAPRRSRASSAENRRVKGAKTGSQSALFARWIEEGFFDQPRRHADVVKKFRQAGVVVSPTSMPQLFLKAVRGGQLERNEAEVSGRSVWVYHRPEAKKTA